MSRKSSPLFIILAGWTCVSIVYFVIQAWVVLNSNEKCTLLPMILALGVLMKNVGEPTFDQFVSSCDLPDYVLKYVHKYPILKTMGVTHSSCSVFELLRSVTYGCIGLASIIDVARTPDFQSSANLIGNLAFRAVLFTLLIFKSPFEIFLSRLVSSVAKGTAAGQSIAQLFILAGKCLVLRTPLTTGSVNVGTCEASDEGSSEGSVNTVSNGNGNATATATATAPAPASSHRVKGCPVPTGSAILLAVLMAVAVETAVLTVTLSTPLLLDLFSQKLSSESAGLHVYPLLAPARLSAPLFSHTGCVLLVAGAAVQCAALFFVAGYLAHRRAIALELRSHAAATSSLRNAGASANTTSTTTSTTTIPITAPSKGPSSFSLGVGSFLLSLLDCDVRLSVSLENCRGSGRLSSTDAFSAGLQSTAAGGSNIGSSNNTNNSGNNALSVASGNNGNVHINNNSNNKTGGKVRLSVTIPTTNSPNGHNHSNSNNNSSGGSPRKDSVGTAVATAEKSRLQQLQFAPQPHMLLICVLPVLLVAALQLVQVLLNQVDKRCCWGYAVSGVVTLLLVGYLRDAIPRACCSEASTTASHPAAAATPSQTASMHGAKH